MKSEKKRKEIKPIISDKKKKKKRKRKENGLSEVYNPVGD